MDAPNVSPSSKPTGPGAPGFTAGLRAAPGDVASGRLAPPVDPRGAGARAVWAGNRSRRLLMTLSH
jgi:hypothetical protein